MDGALVLQGMAVAGPSGEHAALRASGGMRIFQVGAPQRVAGRNFSAMHGKGAQQQQDAACMIACMSPVWLSPSLDRCIYNPCARPRGHTFTMPYPTTGFCRPSPWPFLPPAEQGRARLPGQQ